MRLSRPHFVLGGALMYALGAVTARPLDRNGYLLGQAVVTFAQVTAHYVNEYADVEADRGITHRTWFSGGSGVLVDGSLTPGFALRAAQVTTSLTLVGVVWLLVAGRWQAALLGVASLVVSWLYSLPPIRLLGTGWGELATTMVVTVAVPMVGVFANGGTPGPGLWWAVAMVGCVHLAMMLCFEIPDLDPDAAAGKRVLGVRLGRSGTGRLISAMLAAAAAVLATGVVSGGLPAMAAWAVLAALPGAVVVIALRRAWPGALTAGAVGTLVVAGSALTVALAG